MQWACETLSEGHGQLCVSGLQADAEVLKDLVERHRDVLVEKDREMVRRLQAACDEDFRKTATLHEEKWVSSFMNRVDIL